MAKHESSPQASSTSQTLNRLEALHSKSGEAHAAGREFAEAAVIDLIRGRFKLSDPDEFSNACRCATNLLLWGRTSEAVGALRQWNNPHACDRTLQCTIGASECAAPESVEAVARLSSAEAVQHAAMRLKQLHQLELTWTGRHGIEYEQKDRLRQAVIGILEGLSRETQPFPEDHPQSAQGQRCTQGLAAIGLDASRPNSAPAPR